MPAIKGERRAETEKTNGDCYLTERSYGSFRRAFALPPNIAADKIDASFAKGALKPMLPNTRGDAHPSDTQAA